MSEDTPTTERPYASDEQAVDKLVGYAILSYADETVGPPAPPRPPFDPITDPTRTRVVLRGDVRMRPGTRIRFIAP
jgi:hypothetical protein